MQDRAPTANGHLRPYGYIAFANPAVRTDPVVSAVEDFTSYKNRNSGIWARGEMHLYKGLKFADNGIGFTHAGGNFDRSFYPFTSRIVDSVFVGESANIGNPRAPSKSPMAAACHSQRFRISRSVPTSSTTTIMSWTTTPS